MENVRPIERREPLVLLLGTPRREFVDAVADLERFGTIERGDSIATCCHRWEAVAERQAVPVFDLIVLLQSFPGEHPASEIMRLRRFYPFTPILLLLGDWCEGTGRTAPAPSGLLRLYGHQWAGRGRDELRTLFQGGPTAALLPPTAGEEEWIVREKNVGKCEIRQQPGANETGRIHLLVVPECGVGIDAAMDDLLRHIYARNGIATTSGGIETITTDATDALALALIADIAEIPLEFYADNLQECRERFPGLPFTLLLHAPHWEETERLRALRPITLLSKPFRICDLPLIGDRR